jgi:signal transduction histidine kinase
MAQQFFGALATGGGVLVLFGWVFWNNWLTGEWRTGMAATSPMTAALIVMLGAGEIIYPRFAGPAGTMIAGGLSSVVALIGALRLADALLGWDTHFDQWLLHDAIRGRGGAAAIGMAPTTAICLVAMGAGSVLIACAASRWRRVGQSAVVGALLVAATVLIGHLYEALGFYQIGQFFPMGLATSMLLLVLGVSVLMLRPDFGFIAILTAPGLGGAMARQLFWIAVVAPPALGLLCLRLARERSVDVASSFGLLVTLTGLVMATAVLISAHRLQKTADALTERSRELEIAQRAAESANTTKTRFLENMSHELRSPLNAIIGFSELLHDAQLGPIDPHYAEYAGDILRSGRDLLATVNQILDLAKIEARQLNLNDEAISLPELTGACMAVVKERAVMAGLDLKLAIPPDIPVIQADEARLRQALVNLLSNAVKFTAPGGTITMAAARAPDGGLEISIADDGIGMSEADLAVAFTPFRQVDSKLSRRYEGAGLGLPLARALVESHGGTLTIESHPGRGTVARVRLPRLRVDPQTRR